MSIYRGILHLPPDPEKILIIRETYPGKRLRKIFLVPIVQKK